MSLGSSLVKRECSDTIRPCKELARGTIQLGGDIMVVSKLGMNIEGIFIGIHCGEILLGYNVSCACAIFRASTTNTWGATQCKDKTTS